MHTTMQTLGRFAIIGGTVLVALVNVILFRDVDNLEQACSRLSTSLNKITFTNATKTVPPIIAKRPRVCIVVCIILT